MHLKKLAVAVSLAYATLVAGGAQAAFPYDPVAVDLFLSGTPIVQSNFIAELPVLFAPGYVQACDNITPNCAAYFAVTGTLSTNAAVPATLQGKTARITYRTRGGQYWGVAPVASAASIEWMKMDPTTCTTATPSASNFNSTLACAPTGDDSGTNANARVPDLGVSEVDPSLFQFLNMEFNPATGTYRVAPSQLDLESLYATGVLQVALGVPMTNVIPTSMFFNKATLRAALSNNGSQQHDWSGIPGAPLAAVNPLNASNGTNKPVVVCRRTPGSGTQATSNYFINGFGCAGSAYVTPSRMADSNGFDATGIYVPSTVTSTPAKPIIIDPSVGYTVIENPGSGDARSCLAAAQAGTNWAFKGDDNNYYQVTFSGAATGTTTPYTNFDTSIGAPFGAIGILSYESAGKENGWHYHDLDGLLTPNAAAIDASGRPATSTAKYAVAAMTEGLWEYYSEATMQYRIGGANGKPALSGDLLTLSQALFALVGDPAVVNVNLGMAVNPTYHAPTGNVTTNKVAKTTKSGRTCRPPAVFYKQQFWN